MTPNPVDFCIAQDMVAVRADPAKVYPRYLFAALRSDRVQRAISNMHVGTLIPHFKKGDFDKLLIPMPARHVQEFLGDAYFEFSAKIELNRRLNETLEAIARAIFKSWFVDFDPVRAKASGEPPEAICRRLGLTPDLLALFPDHLVESELGEIPEGWATGTIADHCYLNAKSWTERTLPFKVHYVDLANVKNGVVSQAQIFSPSNAPSRARRILRAGDTIVGTVRPGNRSFALIGGGSLQLTGSTGFAVLTPKRFELRELVYFLATSEENIARLSHLADGAAYPAVRADVVTAEACVVPLPVVIDAFHDVVSAMVAQQIANQATDNTLAAIRDSLLSKVLCGELRVPLEGAV
jgi:type I restriction enzyme S subunit